MEVYILDSEIVFQQENAQRREEDVSLRVLKISKKNAATARRCQDLLTDTRKVVDRARVGDGQRLR